MAIYFMVNIQTLVINFCFISKKSGQVNRGGYAFDLIISNKYN